jgi:hypothetical protein
MHAFAEISKKSEKATKANDGSCLAWFKSAASVYRVVGAREGWRKVHEENLMKKMRPGLRTLRAASLAVFIVLGLSSPSQATPLDVPLDPFPAILAGFITSSYNATTGVFEAKGWTTTLDTGNGAGQQSFMNEFLLRANISKTGVASGGILQIGTGGALLNSATLLSFGYDHATGGMLEFLFAPVSGSMVTSGMYEPTKPVDVLLYGMGTRFPGNFTNTWASTNNSAQIKVDPPAVSVSEPATLTLMLLAVGGLFTRERWRSVAPPAR